MSEEKPGGLFPTSRPNGVTRIVRRFMSLASAIMFFALILGEFFLGLVEKPVPFFLYAILSSIAIVAHDKFEEMLKLIKGSK